MRTQVPFRKQPLDEHNHQYYTPNGIEPNGAIGGLQGRRSVRESTPSLMLDVHFVPGEIGWVCKKDGCERQHTTSDTVAGRMK